MRALSVWAAALAVTIFSGLLPVFGSDRAEAQVLNATCPETTESAPNLAPGAFVYEGFNTNVTEGGRCDGSFQSAAATVGLIINRTSVGATIDTVVGGVRSPGQDATCSSASGGTVTALSFALDTLHSCVAEFDFGGQTHAFSFTLFGTVTDNGDGTFDGTATRGPLTYIRSPPPSLTLSVDAVTDGTFDVTLTSDVPMDGTTIAASDLTITPVGPGTISSAVSGPPVRVSDTEYRFPITVVGRGDVEFQIAVGAINGATGLANTAASNTVTTNANDDRPTGTFSGLASTVGLAGDQVTLTFSEPVGLLIEDLTLNNLRASNLSSGDGITYTFDVEPIADGPASIFLPAGLAEGGGNTTLAIGPVTTNAVVSRPEITLTSTNVDGPVRRSFRFNISRPGGGRYLINGSSSFPATFTNFTFRGVTLAQADGVYVVTGDLTGGPVIATFPEGVFTAENSGNESIAFGPVEIANIDLTPPTPTITFEGYDLENTFTARITWDEEVTGFEASDITPVNATLGAFAAVSASEYTVEVTAIDLSTAPSINIAADVATDLEGNDNLAATGTPPAPDGTAPVVTITGVPDGFTGPQTAALSFDWGERVLGFDASDITVTGGTLGPLTGGPDIYTAELTVDGDVSVTVAVGEAAVLDESGTSSAASTVVGGLASADIAAELIREFMTARSAALLAAQPNIRGFLTGQGGAAALDVTQGQGTISLRTGSRAPVWVALEASWSELEEADLDYVLATLGAHTWLSEQALVGVMLQYDIAESENGAARLEGTGWLAGPYFAAALGSGPVYVDGRLLYGRTNNEISPLGTYTDDFETERWLATLAVSGRIERPQVTWYPSLELAWTEDTQEAYVDSFINLVPEQTVGLGELTAGLDFERALTPNTLLLGGVSAIYSDSSGGSDALNGQRGRVDLGVRHDGPEGLSYDFGTFYDGLGASDYRAHGFDLTVRFAF